MKKILSLFLFFTIFSMASFASENTNSIEKKPKGKVEKSIKPKNVQNCQNSAQVYCTEVQINLICGGTVSGTLCHSTPAFPSSLFHFWADHEDIRYCGYTYSS
jgi:hypothetical protein